MSRAERRRELRAEGWRGKRSHRGVSKAEAYARVKTKQITRVKDRVEALGVYLP
jgi:hypothetical protein